MQMHLSGEHTFQSMNEAVTQGSSAVLGGLRCQQRLAEPVQVCFYSQLTFERHKLNKRGFNIDLQGN